ncbi:MAG: radical SAM protein [Spirochaetota bacterium]
MTRYRTLFIEHAALAYPHGQALARQFADRPIVPVDSYNEVFSRPGQSFQSQKRSPVLIAAVARPPFLYAAPKRISCPEADGPVYYNDQLRNCVYNCDYCFLQGMHPSGHTLVYVNTADFHNAVADRAAHGPLRLNVSYLTDMLGFETFLPLVAEWIEFARETPNVTVEVRTKGPGGEILKRPPVGSVVLAWTLSPRQVVSRYERGTASLIERLRALESAARRGWRVRIAVDPVVLVPGWRKAYAALLEQTFETVDPALVESASYGVFRMGTDQMHRIAAARADSPILHHPFEKSGTLVSYSPGEIEEVRSVIGRGLSGWLGEERIAFVHG